MDKATTPPAVGRTIAESIEPDAKTRELFDLLALSDPQKREELRRFASVEILGKDLPAHFRLDCLTEIVEVDFDAELA